MPRLKSWKSLVAMSIVIVAVVVWIPAMPLNTLLSVLIGFTWQFIWPVWEFKS